MEPPIARPGQVDEVARQRRKRTEALLDRPVADFDDLTLRAVLRAVVAATEECPEPLDVERFLTGRGHTWQTVEMVVASLALIATEQSPTRVDASALTSHSPIGPAPTPRPPGGSA